MEITYKDGRKLKTIRIGEGYYFKEMCSLDVQANLEFFYQDNSDIQELTITEEE